MSRRIGREDFAPHGKSDRHRKGWPRGVSRLSPAFGLNYGYLAHTGDASGHVARGMREKRALHLISHSVAPSSAGFEEAGNGEVLRRRPMRKVIRTGVIGIGKMGANHARIYATMPGSHLVGIYDPDLARARACAEACGCTAFDTVEALIAAGVEAVSVAVPTSKHRDVVCHVLALGAHVLVEKPIASTVEEAEEMIRTAGRRGRLLMVGHIERFNPAITAIRDSVGSEEIITINIVRVGPRPPRIKDAGVIIDLAVHDIDLVRYLTGQQVTDVYCVSSAHGDVYEDTASILLRTERGVSAQLTVNWITPYKAREIQVITPNRLVRANLLTQHVQSASRYSAEDGSYLVHDLYVPYQEPLRAQLAAFLDAVRRGEAPPVTGEDGLRTLEVALRAAACRTDSILRCAS